MNDGKICVSVCAETADEMISKIRAATEYADLVEVRFDCLATDELQQLRSQIADLKFEKPIVATYRSPEQGGKGSASLDDRIEFWNSESEHYAAIDLEEDISPRVTGGKMRIASHHDFSGVPEDVNSIYDRLAGSDPDVIKIAVTASDITDTIGIWKLLERARMSGKGFIPIAMGDAGKWTRILGSAHGAFLTFASPESGKETAPGQVNVSELLALYRVKHLDRKTKVHGILGDPVSQSLSTFMHNPAFVSQGFNGVFIPFQVKNIDEFMLRMVRPETREIDLNFGGFSVTMPHKQAIIKHLDAIDPTAEKIGAVNTIKIDDDGKLTGYNTDAHGFITPLKARYGDLDGARVAVFGAGGAARACVYSLKEAGATIELFVRSLEKARTFADEFNLSVDSIENFKVTNSEQPATNVHDIIVDTTPVGMTGELEKESLLTADELMGVKFVYDLVTKPYDTPLVLEAKKAGIPAIGGMEMLVAQGAKQFEIWTGTKAPEEQMRAAVINRFAQLNK